MTQTNDLTRNTPAAALWQRRRFLQLAAGSLAIAPLGILGCGGSNGLTGASTGTGAITTTTPGSSGTGGVGTAAPGKTATAGAPSIKVQRSPQQVGIGESMRIEVTAPLASGVLIKFRDINYPMVPVGKDTFWLAVGVPLDATAGPGTFTAASHDSGGGTLVSTESSYQVVAIDRPADYLELTTEEVATLTQPNAVLEAQLRGVQFARFDGPVRWSDVFRRPVDGAITTLFGQGRSINGGPVGQFHTGVDLANDEGTPVLASAPGRVAWTGEMPIRGNSVLVDHGGGAKTGYHHLSAIQANVGQDVDAGDVVGLVGHTGLATGPHLHWELTLWGVNVDPMTWLTTRFGP